MKTPRISRWTLALPLFAGLALPTTHRADSIKITGRSYDDAEMIDLAPEGIVYKTGGGNVVMPWDEAGPFQFAKIKTDFAEAFENLRTGAYWIEGTIFERHKDGFIIQNTIDTAVAEADSGSEGEKGGEETKAEYKNGARKLRGLVIVPDLPDPVLRKVDDAIAIPVYRTGSYTYDAGFNLAKEIPRCSVKKPEWAQEREWTNLEGNKLVAKVIAVKEDKCLFSSNGKTFPYVIAQLSEPDRELIAKFEKYALKLPIF
ncbi:MAG: hypothetical protein H7A53_02815 [Akkermansiaceae bacterium]|nr:hypothetical protein [Akkermansiaceae bacterium]MCP5549816.1 hypothetical protein [Akkermansiaceae bacterium]